MTVDSTDTASYIRGKLFTAGVDEDTPLGAALDVVMTLVTAVPKDELGQWRRKFDPAMWRIRPPDRESWGASPEQQKQMGRLAGTKPQGVAESRESRPGPRPRHR